MGRVDPRVRGSRALMCGISGIVAAAERDIPGMRERLSAMADAMVHRGPDDLGFHLSPDCRVGLTTRRLSIRDLSPAGHMPMGSPDGDVWITYNGEIYNADELRQELDANGCRLVSRSDTEVILHGYRTWGDAVVERLRGMFAFGISDRRPQTKTNGGRLLLARDRLGIKPLYYARTPDGLVFGSELRAIRASRLVGAALNPTAISAYLLTGSVPSPMTIFAGIASLEPGATLAWNGRDIMIEQRLDLSDDSSPEARLTTSAKATAAVQKAATTTEGPAEAGLHEEVRLKPDSTNEEVRLKPDSAKSSTDSTKTPSYQEAVERVRFALEDAVRSHLVSDVPLGAFLSGGLDSSVVVALMRKATTGPLRTCSLIFEEREYSEGAYAREVAEAVGAEHYERVITAAEAASRLDDVFRVMDQPTSDGVNTYFVSETARQAGLTVALSGLGGDELFGGYPCTFQEAPRLARMLGLTERIPGAAALARATVDRIANPRRWGNISAALDRPASLASAYVARRSVFSPAEVQSLLSDDMRAAADGFDPVTHVADRTGAATDTFSWLSRAELRSYTHHQLLKDTDVMSMAHSLEVRVPLLDDRLVRTVLGLPEGIKRQGSGPKPLLVAAVGDLLADRVRSRQDKQGFTLPFDRWLKTTLRSRFEDVLLSDASAGARVFQPAGVRALWDDYLAGRVHWSRPWTVAALLRWCGEHQPAM